MSIFKLVGGKLVNVLRDTGCMLVAFLKKSCKTEQMTEQIESVFWQIVVWSMQIIVRTLLW